MDNSLALHPNNSHAVSHPNVNPNHNSFILPPVGEDTNLEAVVVPLLNVSTLRIPPPQLNLVVPLHKTDTLALPPHQPGNLLADVIVIHATSLNSPP